MSDAMKNKARLALSGGRDIDRCLQSLWIINEVLDVENVEYVDKFVKK